MKQHKMGTQRRREGKAKMVGGLPPPDVKGTRVLEQPPV